MEGGAGMTSALATRSKGEEAAEQQLQEMEQRLQDTENIFVGAHQRVEAAEQELQSWQPRIYSLTKPKRSSWVVPTLILHLS
eukprot:1161724-Pelagomonas_calceolata.AAC.15